MKNKIKKIWHKYRPLFIKTGEILKNNKIIVVIILISILPIYFFGIKPAQVRKKCSTHYFIANGRGYFSRETRMVPDGQYKTCLRQNGLDN